MNEWRPKRFWKTAEVTEAEGGFTVTLDGRPVRTPGKHLLVVPTRAMAEVIAAEWNAQGETLRPETMPFTRAANTAIERVSVHKAAVVEELARYGASDLLCYRAEEPAGLVERQSQGWDPILAWAAMVLGTPLNVTKGIVPVAQDPQSLAALADRLGTFTPFQLTGFHDLVTITGSLVLALAAAEGRLSPDEAWHLARIDETWQIEHWGVDDEAAQAEEVRHQDFLSAARFFRDCG